MLPTSTRTVTPASSTLDPDDPFDPDLESIAASIGAI